MAHHQQHMSSQAGISMSNVPCPTHSSGGKNTLPHSHQHQHHQHLHQHHHSHRLHSSSTNQSSNDEENKGSHVNLDEQQQQHPQHAEKFSTLKRDDSQASRSYSDVRKSAPDVVIISGCTSSH